MKDLINNNKLHLHPLKAIQLLLRFKIERQFSFMFL